MTTRATIQEFVDALVREFRPMRVILFGSHARRGAGSNSDVDLLVLLPFRGKACRKALEILQRLDPPFPIDLVVRTPEQFEKRLREGDFFMQRVEEEGIVLYEGHHARVG